MRCMCVTCPETAHLETLEVEHHPLGILISGCSGWKNGGEATCTRRCASLLDRRERSRFDPDEVTLASLEVGDETRLDLDVDAVLAPRPGS
jgi:hypothetical protein